MALPAVQSTAEPVSTPSLQEDQQRQRDRHAEIQRCREIHGRAQREGRPLSEEEQREYDGHWRRQEELAREIRMGAAARQWEDESRNDPAAPDPIDDRNQPDVRDVAGEDAEERRGFTRDDCEFRNRIRTRWPAYRDRVEQEPQHRARFNNTLLMAAGAEVRMTVGDEVSGGALMPPMTMIRQLIEGLDDAIMVRRFARSFMVPNGTSLGAIKKTRGGLFQMGTEISEAKLGEGPKFEGRKFTPHPATGYVQFTKDLVRGALIDPEQLVREDTVTEGSELQEQKFWQGSGDFEPLGLLKKSKFGISASRDVPAGTAADGYTVQGLYSAKFKLKEGYRQNPATRWCFPADEIKEVAMMTREDGKQLWVDSIQLGEPDRLLGLPTHECEWIGGSGYTSAICHFPLYWVVDGLDITFEVLREKAALQNKLILLARMAFDGMPVLEEGFVRTTRP